MKRTLSEDPDFYKISKFDIVLISLVILFSVVFIAGLNHSRLGQLQASKIALIYQNGKLLEKLSLDKAEIVKILNGKMQIEAQKGKIRVLSADCPQHLCMNMGWIQHNGQTIICVPNKVVIEVKSTGAPLIDAVAN